MKKLLSLSLLLFKLTSFVFSPTVFTLSAGNTVPASDETSAAVEERVVFEGKELPSGISTIDGVQYVLLSEAADAEKIEVEHDGNSNYFSFDWRLGSFTLLARSRIVTLTDSKRKLEAPPLFTKDKSDLYVPLYEFCDLLEIGTWYDEEFSTLYCTAGAGDWELPQGYTVPVFMYHNVGVANDDSANLVVHTSKMEEQLKYLTENGYTTIFFEDLWNVANIEKPVILVFDDGWDNNYRYLLPLLEKYKCKATVAVVKEFTHDIPTLHMSADEVIEMSESEYVSIQSHTVTHNLLGELTKEHQEYELSESQKFLTRLTGKQPFVLVYPTGSQNTATLELMPNYYRFGVKMTSAKPYNTSDDPFLVYRFFVERQTPMSQYAWWLESSFEQ